MERSGDIFDGKGARRQPLESAGDRNDYSKI
jgi:hypothetical protein